MSDNIRLKAMMKEIESVYRKYDVGGVAVLSDGEGHSEFKIFMDTPSWSGVRFLGNGVHIKIHMKSEPEKTNKTGNLVVHTQEMLGHMFLGVEKIREAFESHVKIETVDR